MTFKQLLPLVVISLATDATWPAAVAQDQPARRKTNLIQASRLNTSKVIGFLGHPLGDIVTIEGIAADGDYTRRKADIGETLLRVQAVNGRSLKRESVFQFRPFDGATVKTPSAGTRFKYIGYETGGFSGIPERVFDYVPRVAATGYLFSTSFVILRDDNGSKRPGN